MKHYLHLCFLVATLCGTVSCQQATEELTPTLAKAVSYGDLRQFLVTTNSTDKTAIISLSSDSPAEVVVPSTITSSYLNNVDYTVIGMVYEWSLNDTNNKRITSITLPNTLEQIGERCFIDMAISNIVIPESVTSLGENVFRDCQKLESVQFSANISDVPSYTFSGCSSLKEIKNLKPTSISFGAFFGCKSLPSIDFPEGLKSVANAAFYECTSLKSVTFPSTLEEIGATAFYGCTALESIVLPENLSSIGEVVGTTGTTKGYTFNGCENLTKIVIPSKVSSINEGLFAGCTNLSDVTLGTGVTTINKDAFKNCTKLATLNVYATEPPTLVDENIFSETNYKNCTLYVPKESLNSYSTHSIWGKFTAIKSLDEAPDADKQTAAITDETSTIPVGTYEAGNLTYSRTNAKFEKGVYVTICLPFSINLAETDCFSDVLMPKDIALYNTNSQMLTILMKKADNTTIIPAGTPFLAKLSGDKVELKNSSRTYIRSSYAEDLASNMTTKFEVYNYDGTSGVLESNEDLDVRFCGSFEKKTGLDNTKYRTFMADGRFGKADNIGIYRAYIYKANVESQNKVQALSISTDGVADDIIKGNYTIKGNKLIINK